MPEEIQRTPGVTHATPERIMTPTPIHDTNALMREAGQVVGPKRLAAALHQSLGHTYRQMRDSADVDPEATGCRNAFDSFETIAELCATRGPDGHAVLVQMRGWTDSLFERLAGRATEPATLQVMMHAVADTIQQANEAAAAALRGDRERGEVQREIAEAIASLENLGRIVGSAGGPLKVA